MSYKDEGLKLIEETQQKRLNAIKKYDGIKSKGLDWEPWDDEVREITKEFNRRLKELRIKYPNWEDELKEENN